MSHRLKDPHRYEVQRDCKLLKRIRSLYTEKDGEKFLGEHCVLTVFWLTVPLIRLMQKMKLRVHPNTITLASLPVILSAGYFFFQGKPAIGAFLYIGYRALDDLDGMWARLTGKTSDLGVKLDYFVCVVGNMAMFFGLWYNQYYLRDRWFAGGSLVVAHYAIMIFRTAFIQEVKYNTILPRVYSYYSPEEEAVGTFFLAPLLNSVNILFPTLIILQCASSMILFSRQAGMPDVKRRIKEKLLKVSINKA